MYYIDKTEVRYTEDLDKLSIDSTMKFTSIVKYDITAGA